MFFMVKLVEKQSSDEVMRSFWISCGFSDVNKQVLINFFLFVNKYRTCFFVCCTDEVICLLLYRVEQTYGFSANIKSDHNNNVIDLLYYFCVKYNLMNVFHIYRYLCSMSLVSKNNGICSLWALLRVPTLREPHLWFNTALPCM